MFNFLRYCGVFRLISLVPSHFLYKYLVLVVNINLKLLKNNYTSYFFLNYLFFLKFISILNKIRSSLSDDRQLSIFEISISGLVPALLYLVKFIEVNPSGILAALFTEVFL